VLREGASWKKATILVGFSWRWLSARHARRQEKEDRRETRELGGEINSRSRAGGGGEVSMEKAPGEVCNGKRGKRKMAKVLNRPKKKFPRLGGAERGGLMEKGTRAHHEQIKTTGPACSLAAVTKKGEPRRREMPATVGTNELEREMGGGARPIFEAVEGVAKKKLLREAGLKGTGREPAFARPQTCSFSGRKTGLKEKMFKAG